MCATFDDTFEMKRSTKEEWSNNSRFARNTLSRSKYDVANKNAMKAAKHSFVDYVDVDTRNARVLFVSLLFSIRSFIWYFLIKCHFIYISTSIAHKPFKCVIWMQPTECQCTVHPLCRSAMCAAQGCVNMFVDFPYIFFRHFVFQIFIARRRVEWKTKLLLSTFHCFGTRR